MHAPRRRQHDIPEPPAAATEPVPGTRAGRPIWVLLGRRHGDNQQMLALAAATGLPYVPVAVTFNVLSALPNLLLGASRASARLPADLRLPSRGPAAIISSGRRAVPLARWLQRHGGGHTPLVHVGRPWAPLSWFDLVITTPQYRLPAADNVLCNLLPLGTAARSRAADDPGEPEAPALVALPRPWTAVFLGGPARPLLLDAAAVARVARHAREAIAAHGGGVAFLAGPRTPVAALAALRACAVAPSVILPWVADADAGAGRQLRRHADRFIVTDDSVAMLAELLATGKPVQVAALSRRPDLRLRCAAWLDRQAQRHAPVAQLQQWLIGAGLLASVRDPGLCVTALRRAGLFADGARATWRAEQELRAAALRVRGLADSAVQAVAGKVTRTRNPPSSGAGSNVMVPP